MEIVIALVLFVLIVGSWLFLPATPPAEKPATSAPATASKAGHTA